MDDNVYRFSNGKIITDESVAVKLHIIKALHPESKGENDTGYAWNEIGLADVFGEVYKDTARYCTEHKNWYTYYNGKWNLDESAILVGEKLKEFTLLLTLYCMDIVDGDLRERYLKFVSRLGDTRFRDRVLKDAKGCLKISAVQFDNIPYLINCKNGTYDLRSFKFKKPSSNDFLTRQTNFEYGIGNYRCERWEQFIDEVTEHDREKADYLQRALGYSLLGTAREECMFILYGKTTRNGKSTLLNAIEYLLGDYSDVADTGLISKNRNADPGAANPTLAKLKGKRFVTMSESNKYGALDESAIKQMTGGEPISARALYQTPITFVPQFKLWLSCNDLPDVRDRSLFASERLRVIEFNRHFSQEEQDKNLKDEFSNGDAMKGIFAWLIQGYRNYLARGLNVSARLKNVDKEYEISTDTVLQFLQERCEVDADFQVKAKNLYESYKSWARNYGLKEMSAKWFNAEMLTHVDWYSECKDIQGYKTYKGIKIKELG